LSPQKDTRLPNPSRDFLQRQKSARCTSLLNGRCIIFSSDKIIICRPPESELTRQQTKNIILLPTWFANVAEWIFVSDADLLRDAVRTEARNTIARLQKTLASGSMTAERFVSEWTEVQGEAFSLLVSALAGIIPRTNVQLQDDKGNRQSIEKEIEYLTYQFASVLSALVASPIPITESLMLEPLLVRIVDTAPILKGLGAAVNDELKRIREILENDAEDNIGFAPIRYVFFATLAALSARIKTPNSDENLWARALIRHEWARRALSSNGYPSDDRLSVQSERAARTIKKEIAWDALAHLIAAEIGSVRQSNEAADANITKMKVTEFTTIVSEIAEALGRPGLETEIMATLTADSGDGGQAFHLKADSESGRSRTAFR
ncbi:MAG: hypothetical protein WB822_14995, partial [Rhodoplanes sp.]